MPPGVMSWMCGGQHKVPRVALDPEMCGSLQNYMCDNDYEALPESGKLVD